MPTYDYECELCGEFSLVRSIAERDAPVQCSSCGLDSSRVFGAPNLSRLDPARAKAYAINERSRHEPRTSVRHRCGGGCGCVTRKGKNKATKFQTGRAGSRPWMLGH
ncbi:MAG TPA: FmdB family zinc ribbon protein [Chthoniobacteraceae bacterium]|jgi:putative FmdB family regulatory protein|nr:FmdB family zinc ribbon protein [Chthoniobacteraceae bacterium]